MTSFLASEEAMSSEHWIERGENCAKWLVSHSGWIQGPGKRSIGQTDRDHSWQACALSVPDGDRMTDGSHCERRGMRWRFQKLQSSQVYRPTTGCTLVYAHRVSANNHVVRSSTPLKKKQRLSLKNVAHSACTKPVP